MPPTLSPTAPIAALRTLRRAPWGECLHAELEAATDVLVDPMCEMNAAWTAVVGALRSYQRHQDALSWAALRSSLGRFDGALSTFFGPSGWERPD